MQARSVARTARALGGLPTTTAGLPRTLLLVNTAATFNSSCRAFGSRTAASSSFSPAAAKVLQPRSFSTTSRVLSKDTTWQSKGTVKYAELKPETESPSGEITIIDVREPNEVAQGIIPSAVNVPLSQFQKAFSGSGGDFLREFAFQRPAYDDKVIFYCRSGKRSQQALEFAQKNGWWKYVIIANPPLSLSPTPSLTLSIWTLHSLATSPPF